MSRRLLYKTEITAVGIRCADHATHLYPQKVGAKFTDKRRCYAVIIIIIILVSESLLGVFVILLCSRFAPPVKTVHPLDVQRLLT
jgi:hypothetical protein